MAEKESKRSKRTQPKSKMKKSYQPDDDDLEETNDFNSTNEQEQQHNENYSKNEEMLQLPTLKQEQNIQKVAPPMKEKKAKFSSEPFDMYQKKKPVSLPNRIPIQQIAQGNNFLEEQTEFIPHMFEKQLKDFSDAFVPLPPITSTQNLNEILQTKLQSSSIKAFKVSVDKD